MRISDWSSDVCSSDLETPVRCRIRLVSPADRGRPVTIAQALDRTSTAQGFFSNTGQTFMGLTQLMLKGVNKLPAVDQALMNAMGGDPYNAYIFSAFAVEPGDALLLLLPYGIGRAWFRAGVCQY